MPIAPADDIAAWLVQLHRVLNRDDASVPGALQSALIEIADLATELGHEVIIAQAIERDVDLFAGHEAFTRQDLAFYVHRSHPQIFRAAHARLQPQDVPRFVEFYGDRSATLSRQGLRSSSRLREYG